MRAPKRRRALPRTIQPPPVGVNVNELANTVRYVGSPEHKMAPPFAGAPRPRADATICDSALNDQQEHIQQWLQLAMRSHCFGPPWENGFPRYAWCVVDGVVYEARLVNRGLGHYKGWQLKPEEWPAGIDRFIQDV